MDETEKSFKMNNKCKGEKYLNSFNLKGVLLKKCFFKDQFEDTFEFYLDIPDDSLLYGFLERAGLKPAGKSLGGWYKQDYGNTFGQLISAYSRYYSITRDERFYNKIKNLLYSWASAIEDDGYFFYTRNALYHYTYEKMVGGLVDACVYAGFEDAICFLEKITTWAEKNLSQDNIYADNDCCFKRSAEWYTLPENLYRAYIISGNDRFKNFGDKFLYKDYYNYYEKNDYIGLMKAGERSVTRRHHAYSHINALSSAAMFYLVTGDKNYLKVLENAFNIIKETQIFNTGGLGPGETFMYPEQREETLYSEKFHFETACCSWAILKLTRYLTEFTGKAIYGDWAEKIIYNGIGAMPLIKPNGEVMYFSDYNINGGTKEVCMPWSCCTGTFPIGLTEYHNHVYYYDENGIYINLFLPSTVKYKRGDCEVALNQETDFPAGNVMKITLTLQKPVDFKISIRIPEWIKKDFIISVNNVQVPFNINKGWTEIEKIWVDNDRIKVDLAAGLDLVPLSKDKGYPAVFMLGPVVMASDNRLSKFDKKDLDSISDNSVRSHGTELSYLIAAKDGAEVMLEPFYKIKEGKKYYIYHDPVPDLRIGHESINYGPNDSYWKVQVMGHPVTVKKEKADSDIKYDANVFSDVKLAGGEAHISLKPCAFFETEFSGRGIRWIGNQLQFGGKADIYIDGKYAETVDQYGPMSGIPWMWRKENLKGGKHKIKVTGKDDRNHQSEGFSINVKHLTILR